MSSDPMGTTQVLTAIDASILQDVRYVAILRDAARSQGRNPAPQPMPQVSQVRVDAHREMCAGLSADLDALASAHGDPALSRLARLVRYQGIGA